jgi:hypothetical protein
VQLEQAAQEPDDEQQVLAAVRQRLRARLGLGHARGQIGDVLSQRREALAGDRLADEVGSRPS